MLYTPLFNLVAGPGPAMATPARLQGFARQRVAGSHLPMILPRTGIWVDGRLWSGLDRAQLARLDLYELPFGYRQEQYVVETAAGTVPARVYLPPVDLCADGTAWSLDDWITAEGAVTLLAAGELAASDPWPDGPGLLRQWPMIWSRAHAALRASQTVTPATLRHAAQPGDFDLQDARPPQGQFFRFAAMTLTHRRFDGGRSPKLAREMMVGADAALVLPYDPGRDRVLLVEQFRPGAARRGDPNPWTLEPVAGIVDAGETPQDAALRECAEEAGVTPRALERMFAVYASPGSTTDHFYCYLGLCDLPDDLPRRGGLAEEAEDLRLHLLGLDAALALIDSGEASAAPLVAMLLWLARQRGRIRDQAGMSNPGGASAKPSN